MIVALYSPKPQSGKDTVAKYLTNIYDFEEKHFSRVLKNMLVVFLYNYVEDPRLWLEEKKNEPIPGLGVTPRHLMGTLGTDWGRDLVDRDLWFKLETRHLLPNHKYVFTDLRFENEYYGLRELGAILIKIIRTESDIVEHPKSEGNLEHLEFDHTLNNNGTLDELYKQVEKILC